MVNESRPARTRSILSSEVKANLGHVLDDVYSRGTRYIITRFDTPRAVLIPVEDYQRLLAADKAGLQMIKEARTTYDLGEERTPEEIAALLGEPLGAEDVQ